MRTEHLQVEEELRKKNPSDWDLFKALRQPGLRIRKL